MVAYVPGAPNWMPGLPQGGMAGLFQPAGGGGQYWPQALMGLGAGMAQAGAPSPVPGGWGKAIGLGLLGAQNMMQQAKSQSILDAQNQRAQAAETRAQTQFDQQQQQYERQQQFMQNMSGMQGPPGQFAAFALAFPEQAGDVAGKIMLNQAIPPKPDKLPQNQQDAQILTQGAMAINAGTFDQLPLEVQTRYSLLQNQMTAPRSFNDPATNSLVTITPQFDPLGLPTVPQAGGAVPSPVPAAPGAPMMPPTLPAPVQPPIPTTAPTPRGVIGSAQAAGPTTQSAGGVTITRQPTGQLRPDQQKDFAKASASYGRLRGALNRYLDSLRTSGTAWREGQARDLQQSAFEDVKLELKELKQLGVLQGPDEAILERLMGGKPGTTYREGREFLSQMFGGEGNAGGLLPILEQNIEPQLEQTRLEIERLYGRQPIGFEDVQIGGQTFTRADIRETAQKHGMTEDQVIQELQRRYGGSPP